MKYLYLGVLTFCCFFYTQPALAVNCNSTCQLTQVELYFNALDKISLNDSTVADIDALLSLTHENVEYIHVEYQANFSKESWRKAFIRNLERGAYQNTKNNEIRISNTIFGKDYVAVEYSHGVILSNNEWQASEPLLALFGFTDGKISLIKELW